VKAEKGKKTRKTSSPRRDS